jgi:hypothetical protein
MYPAIEVDTSTWWFTDLLEKTTIHPKLSGDSLCTMRPVTVGILSIGDMGLGMARLLKAHDYRVVTVAEGRRYASEKGTTTED